MDNSRWTQLHTHTRGGSLLDGIIKRSDLIKFSKEMGCPAVCITEHGTILNLIKFAIDCKEAGIKPIIGMEAYVSPKLLTDEKPAKYNDHLLLLAYNRVGYNNLIALSSISFERGYRMSRGRIDYQILSEHAEGLIVGSGCMMGRLCRLLYDDKYDSTIEWVGYFNQLFPGRFYIELMDNGWSAQKLLNPQLIRLANDTNTPMIATNDVHYLRREDVHIQDMALAIQTKQTLNSPDRKMTTYENGNLISDGYFKSLEEMMELGFPQSAYDNVGKIIDQIEDYGLAYSDPMMPHYWEVKGEVFDARKKIEEICLSNWWRIGATIVREEQEYEERLNSELDVIEKLGFLDYFLIIWDIINYCKANNILTGPGRGSASGSLVVYLLGITEVDPIKYGLYFERFLNPERISPPDIDFDVEQGRRQEVLQHLKNRWGRDNVIQIGTFNRMAVKDTIKKVGKALAIELKIVTNITKQIEIDDGTKNHTMEELEEKQPSIRQQMDATHYDWWKYCVALCNMPTSIGVHAAGVVISDVGLAEVPTCVAGAKAEGAKLNTVTQFDMHVIEKMGYVKFDLLGLKSLDVIHETIKMLREAGNAQFKDARDIYNEKILPLDDLPTYELISSGNTSGVFQLEGEGFKGLCRALQPESFDQIAALNALYRPGPIGSGVLDSYVERRHGREPVVYDFPEMEYITGYTYGLCLYQEQLMRLSMEVAGYTLPEADNLRKIIGKKLVEKIEEEGKIFIERGLKCGKYSESDLIRAFEIIKPAGRYAWNLAHSVAYGYITYIMAYLKVHYPAEFYAASLNLSLGDSKRLAILIRDAKEYGMNILPPSVNVSGNSFKATPNGIIYGLQSINGIGESASGVIIEERERNGLYEGLMDFVARTSGVNLNHKQALVNAGAFDNVDPDAEYTRASISEIFSLLSGSKKAKKYKKSTLDKGLKNAIEAEDQLLVQAYKDALSKNPDDKDRYVFYPPILPDELPDVPEWDDMTIYRKEVQALGISLSAKVDSIFEDYIKWLGIEDFYPIAQAKELDFGWRTVIAGICTKVHKINTKTGKEMAFIELTDDNDSVSVTLFPETWENFPVQTDNSYVVYCHVDMNKDNTETQLIGDKALDVLGGIKITGIEIQSVNGCSAERLQEFGNYQRFEINETMLFPKNRSNYFTLTSHFAMMMDLLVGETNWKAFVA